MAKNKTKKPTEKEKAAAAAATGIGQRLEQRITFKVTDGIHKKMAEMATADRIQSADLWARKIILEKLGYT